MIKITLLYAGILGMLLVVLAFNVTYHWVRVTGIGMQTDRIMRRSERVLSSFIEFVPLTVVLLLLIELRGAPALIIHILGITLVASRVLHAYALNQVRGAGFLRALGSQATYLVLMVASLACVYFYAFDGSRF